MTLDALIYFALIALWSAIASYVILFRIFRMGGKPRARVSAPNAHEDADRPEAHPTAHLPARTPYPVERPKGTGKPFSAYEGFRSFAEGAELTVEDIVRGLSRRG